MRVAKAGNHITQELENKFSKQSEDVVRGFLCQFSVI